MVTNRDRKWFGSRRKNSKSFSDDWHRWRFWSAIRHFGTHFAERFRMSKSSWMMDPTLSREMPSCSAIDLAEIRRSSKISLWILSIISGVVTVLGRPGWGVTQVEKSPRWNWVTQFWRWHTMVHVPPMFVSEWHEFPSAPCLAGGGERGNLMTARVSTLLKSRASPDMFLSASVTRKHLQFGKWTDASFQWHYRFRPTTWRCRSG